MYHVCFRKRSPHTGTPSPETDDVDLKSLKQEANDSQKGLPQKSLLETEIQLRLSHEKIWQTETQGGGKK